MLTLTLQATGLYFYDETFYKIQNQICVLEMKDKWLMTVKKMYPKHTVCFNLHPYAILLLRTNQSFGYL